MTATEETTVVSRGAVVRWRADLVLAFVALIWGTTFVIVKQALADISATLFLALRFWLASACLFLMFFTRFQAAGTRAVWRGVRGGFVAGVFLWLGYVLQTLGLQYTSAGNSGLLTGLYIVLVPLIGAALYRRWPHVLELVGIGIASAGLVILTIPSLDRSFHLNRGDCLTVGCAVAFAFHLLTLGYFSQRERFEAVALGQIVCSAALSTLSLVIARSRVVWSPRVLFALAVTGIFATALAFALQTWGQQHTSATRTALIFALEPVFALVTAVVLGGERLTIYSAAGGSLILAGILAVELRPVATSIALSEPGTR